MKKRMLSIIMALCMVITVLVSAIGVSAGNIESGGDPFYSDAHITILKYSEEWSNSYARNLFGMGLNQGWASWNRKNSTEVVEQYEGYIVFQTEDPICVSRMEAFHAKEFPGSIGAPRKGSSIKDLNNAKAYKLDVFDGEGVPQPADYLDDTKWTTVGEETNNTDNIKSTACTMDNYAQYFRFAVVDGGNDDCFGILELKLYAKTTTALQVTFATEKGGTGTMPAVTHNPVESYLLPECTMTPDEGYIFNGWRLPNGDVMQPGQRVKIEKDTVFTATWKKQNVTLTFQPGDHGTGEPYTKEVGNGVPVDEQGCNFNAEPNWAFNYWADSQGKMRWDINPDVSATETFTEDTVLTAVWKNATTYAVTFETVPGVIGHMDPINVSINTKIYMPACGFVWADAEARDQYVFSHWEIAGKSYYPGSTYTVTGNVTAKPIFKPVTDYDTVKPFIGGMQVIGTSNESVKNPVSALLIPGNIAGCHWTPSGNGAWVVLELPATYNLEKFAIQYNDYNFPSTGKVAFELEVLKDEAAYYAASDKATFLAGKDNWKVVATTEKNEAGNTVVKDGTVFTVTFAGKPTATICRLHVKNFEISGSLQDFKLWGTKQTAVIVPVTITLDPGTGKGTATEIEWQKNSNYVLPECPFTEQDGVRAFTGWSVNGEMKKVGDAIAITDNIVVTACWKTIESYKLTFAAGRATGEMKPAYCDKTVAKYTLPEPTFVPDTPYTFAGWSVNGSADLKAAGTEITLTTDVTLTACYKMNIAENFTDEVFRKYINSNFDKDHDGFVIDRDLDVTTLTIDDTDHLYSLGGIEHFRNLTEFVYLNSELGENDAVNGYVADFSKNTKLKTIKIVASSGSYLKGIHVNGCVDLETLWVNADKVKTKQETMTALDVSTNTKLVELDCSGNSIGSLNLTANTALQTLKCDNNHLNHLDLSENTVLTTLSCVGNNSYSLDGIVGSNVVSATGGSVKDGKLMFDKGSKEITYTYNCGNSKVANPTFTVKRMSLPDIEIAGCDALIDNNIILRVYAATERTDSYMIFTFPDGSVHKAPGNPVSGSPGIYSYSCPVAAKQMTDDIRIDFEAAADFTTTYSVERYLDSLLAQEVKPDTQNMVIALANYGAASQELFDYHTERPINRILTADQQKIKSTSGYYDAYTYTEPVKISAVASYFATLELKETTAMNIYFVPAQNADNNEFTFFWVENGVEKEASAYLKNGKICVSKDGIQAFCLAKAYTLRVKYGSINPQVMDITFSPFHYGNIAVNTMHNEKLTKAMLAMADYYEAAYKMASKA